MNLADLTSALTQKDSEKATVIAEIDKVKELQEQGFVGTLTTSVVHIDHLALDSNFNIHFLLDSELSKAQNGTENKALSESISLLLKSFDQSIEIRVVVDDESYTAALNVNDVPGDAMFMTELDAAGIIDGSKVIKLHVKSQADFFHALLDSKNKVLEQCEKEFEEIAQQIKEMKRKETASKEKPASGTKEKGKKKGTRKSTKPKEVEPPAEEAGGVVSTVTNAIQEYSMVAVTLGLQYRSVLLFAVAAGLIATKGEIMSV